MTTPATRWVPPDPQELPELRAELLDHYDTDPAVLSMREALRAGHTTLRPTVPRLDASRDAVGAQIMVKLERHRLADAALYYATPDMTALALAAAQTPPVETVNLDRLPAESGLMVFAEPIGGYVDDIGASLASTLAARPGVDAKVTTPIVAVSWSMWTPDSVQLDRGSVEWVFHRGSQAWRIPRDYQGVWITFYSPRGLFSGLPAGTLPDGSVMTAGSPRPGPDPRGPGGC